MQSTGQGSTHLPQPEQSSGMITTSMPGLKIAPNRGGHERMQVSHLRQIDMSIHSGGFCHLGFRSRESSRSPLVPAVTAPRLASPLDRMGKWASGGAADNPIWRL